MTSTGRASRCAAVAIAIALVTAPAAAGDASADDLFREGMQLIERGEVKTACEKFAASYKLDPAPGTLFNLAACHERDGRHWLAREEFLDLVERASNVGRADKAEAARARVTQVEAHLPKIALELPADGNVATVLVDGRPIARDAWAAPIPVDIGAHVVEFRAPGKRTAVEKASTSRETDVVRVRVPFLADAPEATTDAQAAAAASPSSAASHDVGPRDASSGGSRALGFVVAGAGIAVLGVGAFFGVRALSEKGDARDACGAATRTCVDAAHAADAQRHLDAARTDALVSTVGVGVGVAALAVGAFLVLRRHGAANEAASLHVAPLVGPGEGGLAVRRSF